MARIEFEDERRAVIDACRRMNALGINQGSSGNVSRRVEGGFLISASGVSYEAMEPRHVVRMDLDGGYFGEVLPSSEWRMHANIYTARAEAGAVVHTHSTHATALSCLRQDIPPFHYMIGATGASVLRCSDYASFGTAALSETMLKAMEGSRACLLANHGMICFGANLNKALGLAVEVETLCHQYVIAKQAGDPMILDEAEMADILRRFRAYGKQPEELEEGEAPAFEPPVRRD